ncbi:hypothetical protein SNE510_08300 [Streptomyces sp. NE5-10]|nr:hypothetical protein SNE510_08300 [Streptomyces sp. NE5-10]
MAGGGGEGVRGVRRRREEVAGVQHGDLLADQDAQGAADDEERFGRLGLEGGGRADRALGEGGTVAGEAVGGGVRVGEGRHHAARIGTGPRLVVTGRQGRERRGGRSPLDHGAPS